MYIGRKNTFEMNTRIDDATFHLCDILGSLHEQYPWVKALHKGEIN